MAYVSSEARQELLDTIAEATDEMGAAIAALGGAYELMDDASADRMEEQLFRPTQAAYGRAKRTYSGFAERFGLVTREFEAAGEGLPSTGAQGFLEEAVEAVASADTILAELQDSMRPVEVGDAELRAGLAEVRELLGDLRARARELVRTLGR
ncbi:MAG: hypothetical protein H0V29_06915 [Thermoleophilaceae bacterium]|nr:hypothetical protein [Thermoleophilaceae bacterium]